MKLKNNRQELNGNYLSGEIFMDGGKKNRSI
jgi:hypothetical protein